MSKDKHDEKEKILGDKDLKSIDKKIAIELGPFLDCLRAKPESYDLFKNNYAIIFSRLGRAAVLIRHLNEEYPKVKSNVYRLFFYLGLVESYGNTIVDTVVLLLVASGKDFHIECQHTTPRIKHAITIHDLEKERVPLTTKLNFLRDNGLNFFASLVDTKLRNTIAHMKFDIKKDEIFVKGRNLTEEKLTNITRQTAEALIAADRLITEVMKSKGFRC